LDIIREELFVLDHDDFHRATLGGFANFVLMVVEADTFPHQAGVVSHFEDLRSGIFAEIANCASLFNPDLLDSHDSFLSRMWG